MALSIKNLTVKIDNKILVENLTLEFISGKIYGVLGSNGVGKTTLLETIANIKKCPKNKIFIDTVDVTQIIKIERAKKIGFLMQEPIFNFPATVLETLLLSRFCYNKNKIFTPVNDFILAKKILHKFSLTALVERCVTTLSSGEKKRVALATLLMQTPKIYLLDEPINHLDIMQQINTLKIFTDLAKKYNKTVIIVMHDINLIKKFCDNVLILQKDKNYIYGSCEHVLHINNLQNIFAHDF